MASIFARLLGLGFLCAFTRVLLTYHYVSDVVGTTYFNYIIDALCAIRDVLYLVMKFSSVKQVIDPYVAAVKMMKQSYLETKMYDPMKPLKKLSAAKTAQYRRQHWPPLCPRSVISWACARRRSCVAD